jgi:hypothetical protein
LPTIKSLRAEYSELLTAKKKAYPEYQATRKDIKRLSMAEQILIIFSGIKSKLKK